MPPFPFPEHTRIAIENWPDSGQAKAYNWLLNDPNLDTYQEWKRKQRFALATLYYATDGPNWKWKKNWMEYDVDECEWFWLVHNDKQSPCRGRVLSNSPYIVLFLKDNNLKGTIPPEISFLDEVRYVLFLLQHLVPSWQEHLTRFCGTVGTGCPAQSQPIERDDSTPVLGNNWIETSLGGQQRGTSRDNSHRDWHSARLFAALCGRYQHDWNNSH